MDILGSIMKNMVKPPSLDAKEREQKQKQQEMFKKQKEEEQVRIKRFKDNIIARIRKFVEEEDEGARLVFEPMNKTQRAIIHDLAEQEEVTAHSFGQEEVNRHVVLYKTGSIPDEAELMAMKRGEDFKPPQPQEEEEQTTKEVKSRKYKGAVPQYQQKYQKHLGGNLAVAKAAAKSTETNRSYGFVSSEQKRDKRTIEETLADIRARKKQRNEED